MDVSKINALGWSANIPLETGIEMVYQNVKDKF
jgi:nucleoside-diphosphate-sugar epimerase